MTPPCPRTASAFAMTLLALLITPALLAGCAAVPITPGSPAPPRLALELRTARSDSRVTLFELTRDGTLRYAGGRDAVQRTTEPVLTLSPEQRQAVWDIITRHRLLEARGVTFAKAQSVTYDITLSTGSGRRSYRALDDQVPGLDELHAALFEFQAAVRYKVPGIK